MLGYLTTSDIVSTDRLLSLVRGKMDEADSVAIAQQAFDSMIYNAGDEATPNSPMVSIDQCKLFLNSKKFPDIADGVLSFLPAYCNGDELSADGFMCLCADMHNSSPQSYGQVMKDLWGDLV